MTKLEVDSLKTLREDLCMAQSALWVYGGYTNPQDKRIARLGKLIDQIDVLRPLGSDGKHGDLHTEFCGCDGNPGAWYPMDVDWSTKFRTDLWEINRKGDIRDARTKTVLEPYWDFVFGRYMVELKIEEEKLFVHGPGLARLIFEKGDGSAPEVKVLGSDS